MKVLSFVLFFISSIFAYEKAYFAGGCFWCVEEGLEKDKRIKNVTSGYIGKKTLTPPTYKQVSQGLTEYVEGVEVTYDPQKISYQDLVGLFWKVFDPTDNEGQFADRGKHYAPAIYYSSLKEKEIALESKNLLISKKIFKKPIITPILEMTTFYPAEDYHQDYYKKNKVRYNLYKLGSGRYDFLKKHWGK